MAPRRVALVHIALNLIHVVNTVPKLIHRCTMPRRPPRVAGPPKPPLSGDFRIRSHYRAGNLAGAAPARSRPCAREARSCLPSLSRQDSASSTTRSA